MWLSTAEKQPLAFRSRALRLIEQRLSVNTKTWNNRQILRARSHQVWPVGAFEFLEQAEVITPAHGKIERELYGEKI